MVAKARAAKRRQDRVKAGVVLGDVWKVSEKKESAIRELKAGKMRYKQTRMCRAVNGFVVCETRGKGR